MSDTNWWVEYTAADEVPMRVAALGLEGAISVLDIAIPRHTSISDAGIFEGGTGEFAAGSAATVLTPSRPSCVSLRKVGGELSHRDQVPDVTRRLAGYLGRLVPTVDPRPAEMTRQSMLVATTQEAPDQLRAGHILCPRCILLRKRAFNPALALPLRVPESREQVMWHYEYKLEDREFRFEAETFEDCLAEVLSARSHSPHLTGVRVFEGGSMEFGSGIKRYDALEPIVSLH